MVEFVKQTYFVEELLVSFSLLSGRILNYMIEGISLKFPENAVSFTNDRGSPLAVVQQCKLSKDILRLVLLDTLLFSVDKLLTIKFTAFNNVNAVAIITFRNHLFSRESLLLFHCSNNYFHFLEGKIPEHETFS